MLSQPYRESQVFDVPGLLRFSDGMTIGHAQLVDGEIAVPRGAAAAHTLPDIYDISGGAVVEVLNPTDVYTVLLGENIVPDDGDELYVNATIELHNSGVIIRSLSNIRKDG
jgi:hypothetical protein